MPMATRKEAKKMTLLHPSVMMMILRLTNNLPCPLSKSSFQITIITNINIWDTHYRGQQHQMISIRPNTNPSRQSRRNQEGTKKTRVKTLTKAYYCTNNSRMSTHHLPATNPLPTRPIWCNWPRKRRNDAGVENLSIIVLLQLPMTRRIQARLLVINNHRFMLHTDPTHSLQNPPTLAQVVDVP